MAELTLILGGARSGKTARALELCRAYPSPRLYLATGEARDNEMSERIARHRAERGPAWRTVEEPLEPERVLRGLAAEEVSVVLLDCLTMWMSNLMGGLGHGVDEVVDRVRDLAAAALACPVPVVIVSNEVGQGIVPDNKMARDFRDAAGWAHQELARAARDARLVVAGLDVRLK